MSAKRSIARFLYLREKYPDGYAIWHSRIATHGVKNESNCHPFPVGNDGLTYLAHNGVLDVDQLATDKRSDSRVFAEEILPEIGGVCSLDNGTIWKMVSKWASGSKLAILTLDPKAEHQLYIINESSGTWDEHKIWWSNTHHRPAKAYAWGGNVIGEDKTWSDSTPSMTRVRSILNAKTGMWEAYLGAVPMHRKWESGDKWDATLHTFQTPAPGTVEARIVSCLPAVVVVEDELTEEEYEELEYDGTVKCPACDGLTDTVRDPNYCLICHTCFDCSMSRVECMCYIPHSLYGMYRGYAY